MWEMKSTKTPAQLFWHLTNYALGILCQVRLKTLTVCVILFSICFFFIPFMPQLHKWYENDNNLLLLMQDNFVSKSWQTSLRKLLITNCQNVSKTVKFHTQHTIDIMTKNVCLSCLFLFFEPPTKSSCPRSHWWVSSTPFGIPFCLPVQF